MYQQKRMNREKNLVLGQAKAWSPICVVMTQLLGPSPPFFPCTKVRTGSEVELLGLRPALQCGMVALSVVA